ncbi:MAG: hypothetical protein RLZZ70_372 [Candidatus Parcubacteria bacterium]|jgi:triosephosphate isomerase
MATKKQPLIIGNWKMNPRTAAEAVALAKGVHQATKKIPLVTIGVTPPTLFISEVSRVLGKSGIRLGAQQVHPGPVGAFTGLVSPAMIAPYGASYAIVGHSECRARGESDTDINAATLMLLKHKMTPVICVGEKVRDAQANFYATIEAQIMAALATVPRARYKEVVIAYEPIWAIGTGKTATALDVQEMQLFIRKVLTKIADRSAAAAVTVLYGGSVKPDTAASLYREGEVNGFLVGGASLSVEEFTKIITAVL